jgi:hypothetical protein
MLRLPTAYRLTLAPDGPARSDSYSFGMEGPKAMRPNEMRLYWQLFSHDGEKLDRGIGDSSPSLKPVPYPQLTP